LESDNDNIVKAIINLSGVKSEAKQGE